MSGFDQPVGDDDSQAGLGDGRARHKPPIRAWEELVGRPSSQVMRFQEIAPRSPAKTTTGVTAAISIIPVPIVWATAVPKMRKATKLKKAAQTTACRGVRTRVETMVAIELAASCMPLVKSKARATRMMKMTRIRPAGVIASSADF